MTPPRIIVVMGVAGAGKTRIGRLLAEALGAGFVDADDYHSPDNIARMRRGLPLTDADRLPWLSRLAGEIRAWDEAGRRMVLACSALRQSYRDILGGNAVGWVYLKGSPELIASRLAARRGHFLPPSLLESQFAALEEPSGALVADVSPAPETIVARLLRELAGGSIL